MPTMDKMSMGTQRVIARREKRRYSQILVVKDILLNCYPEL